MADSTNPLKLAYNGLWQLLETKSEFTDLFPNNTSHQVRYSSSLDYLPEPDMEHPMPANYPRCRIVLVKPNMRLNFCNDGSSLSPTFRIEICTGHQLQERIFDAVWAIYLSFSKWVNVLRHADTGVKWNGELCITDLHDDGLEVTEDSIERNRGTNQWIAIIQCTITLNFATADLIAQ